MAQGTLKITAQMGMDALPVEGVAYAILDENGRVLFNGITNANGEGEVHTLEAPPRELSLTPNPNIRPYAVYNVWVGKPGFVTKHINNVQVFDGVDSILPVDMQPLAEGVDEEEVIDTPPPTAAIPTTPQAQVAPPDESAISPLVLSGVSIPEFVTVHLGIPGSSAQNVRVRFIDYVKNVTSSEIYPTWPNNSIIANVHAIVSLVLNRFFTEWYRSRGYDFDITNSTTVDQAFVYGRNIYQNISEIVDGIFNVYARRKGFINPYFTEYCNGTTVTCKGLSQWGTVTLANRGFTPLQILHNYYPNDLELVAAPSGTNIESFPGTLRLGSTGESVRQLQNRLNRIRANYPLIPQITNPNGVFGTDTRDAVRVFQQTFNLTQDGVVGRATWNKVTQIFVAITKLAELNGEGIRIGLSPTPPTIVIRQGSRGADVIHAQFLLNYVAQFYSEVPAPIVDSVFGASTTDAVKAFQRRFGLTQDGIIGPGTWRKLYEVVAGIIGQEPPTMPTPPVTPPSTSWPPFPGVLLRQGSSGSNVVTLQQMLNNSRRLYASVPSVSVDGIFGPLTTNSVRTFQRFAGLIEDGVVGPLTWEKLRNIPTV